MSYTYSINFESRRKYFYNFLFMALFTDFLIIGLITFVYKLSFDIWMKILLMLFLWTLIIYILPLIFLHINYMRYNKGSKLMIEDTLVKFYFKRRKIDFSITDVTYISINMSVTLFEKRIRWFFWDELFYYKIHLKNGSSILITCFLCDDLLKHFPNVEIRRKKQIFPKVLSAALL